MDVKETLENVKDKAVDLIKDDKIKGAVKGALDKTDIDEKIMEKVGDLAGKAGGK